MSPKNFNFQMKQEDISSAILSLLVELKVSKDFIEEIILTKDAEKKGITLDELSCNHANFLNEKKIECWRSLYEHYGYIDKKDIGLD